ncbi:MAG: hypothetical protein JST92_03980, partial [Deltaproteobacteria bacterium]|nr:hypothetical protein [Deltaproteobacteria bacterium]
MQSATPHRHSSVTLGAAHVPLVDSAPRPAARVPRAPGRARRRRGPVDRQASGQPRHGAGHDRRARAGRHRLLAVRHRGRRAQLLQRLQRPRDRGRPGQRPAGAPVRLHRGPPLGRGERLPLHLHRRGVQQERAARHQPGHPQLGQHRVDEPGRGLRAPELGQPAGDGRPHLPRVRAEPERIPAGRPRHRLVECAAEVNVSESGSIIVQKYGGSSVADADKITRVAARIAETKARGHQVVVVVSAMGDTTDDLLALAKKVSADPHRRELDMLLTAGERISMALLGLALHARGVDAVSFTGSQSGIITDGAHSNARILEVRPVRILEELGKGRVVIVAGYQGVSRAKEITTLGRGGSDTTAVALA